MTINTQNTEVIQQCINLDCIVELVLSQDCWIFCAKMN